MGMDAAVGAGGALRQARTSVLFTALAAEAYVNEFLSASDLSKARLKKLDGLPTVKKYTDATAEAFGEPLLGR